MLVKPKHWAAINRFTLVLVATFIPVWLLCVLALGAYLAFDLKASELAAWVQAIGAMLAIAAAGFFPYFHERRKDQRREQRVADVLSMLARQHQEQLRLLHSTLYNAVIDWGEGTITPYLQNQWHQKWPAHIDTLKSLELSSLDAGQIYMVTEMKKAADFAWAVCGRLDDWDVTGEREAKDLAQLKHYWELATLTVAMQGTPRRK